MKKMIQAAAVGLLLAVLALIFSQINRTGMIIRFGLRGTNLINISIFAIGGVCAALSGGGLLSQWLKRLKNSKVKKKQPAVPIFEKDKPVDPDKIRAELLRLQRERVQLKDYLQRGLTQMDSIDRKQAKFKDILELGAFSSVNEVGVTVDETEQALCKKLMRVVNRAILWDSEEAGLPGKEEIYKKHINYITKTLDGIDELLNLCDILLSNTLNYLDEKNSESPDDGKIALEVMNEVIQSLQSINQMED